MKTINGLLLVCAASHLAVSAEAQSTYPDFARDKPSARDGSSPVHEVIRIAQSATDTSASPEEGKANQRQADATKIRSSRVLEEIIVTAQKREENLQDVPLSLSVLTGETIERRSMVSLEDFVKYVPGVSLHEMGPGLNSVTIRGIGAAGDPTTGMYLGEIPLVAIGGLNNPDIKLVDMERVEVLRGPQGTLFGSGSMGGTLRYVPNAPDLEAVEGKLDVGYSQTDKNGGENKEITAALSIPLIENELAVRVAGYHFDNAGYIDYIGARDAERSAFAAANGATVLDGGDGGAAQFDGGRATVLWKPVQMLSATLTYLNQKIDQDGFGEESLRLRPYEDSPLSFGNRTPGGKEGRYLDSEVFNLSLELSFDKFSIVSSTSHLDYKGGERRDASRIATVGAFPAVGVFSDATSRATMQEVRISSAFDGPVNFLAGGYYEDNDYKVRHEVIWFGSDALCCGPFGTNPNDILNQRLGDSVEQKAVFSEVYYNFTDALKLTLGGRYFEYDRATFYSDSGFLQGTDTRESDTSDGTTLRVNLAYKPSERSLLYVQWAQGFRLGRPVTPPPANICDLDGNGILDGTASTPVNSDRLEPDTVDSWELGGKFTLFDNRFTLNGSVYRTLWDDMPGVVLGECGFSAAVNTAQARSQGFELESSVVITTGLSMNVGASVVDAELTKNAATVFGEKGDPLPGVAPFQFNVGVQYETDVLGNQLFTRADYTYVDSYHADFAETSVELGKYGKLDIRAGVMIGKYQFDLYGTNLTNEDAATSGFAAPFARVWRLRPRTIGADIRYSF